MPFSISSLRFHACSALFLASGLVSLTASADPSQALDRIDIAVGAYAARPNIDLGVNTQYGSADSGNLAQHEITVPRAHADFLLGDSQGISLDYYGFYNDYSDTLNRSFSNGGNNININGTASAHAKLDVANAAYKWWFGHGSDVFGIGVGAAYYRIDLGVTASGSTNINNASGAGSASYSNDAVAPLVDIGWRHAFDPNTRMYIDASGIKKNGGDLSGHIYNAAIGAEWYFMKNIGVGAEYSISRIRIDDNSGNANLAMRLDGPTVFLKARF